MTEETLFSVNNENSQNNGKTQRNEWNEYMQFVTISSNLYWLARVHQQNKDLDAWHTIVEGLIIHIAPILDEKELNNIKIKMEFARKIMSEKNTIPENSPAHSKKRGELYNAIMDLEITLRMYHNRHSNFLKLSQGFNVNLV